LSQTHLPLFIDFSGRRVVIFGGGSVGERKALLFSEYAEVMVVSQDFTDTLKHLQHIVNLVEVKDITEEVINTHVKNAFLVIPATNRADLNAKIEQVAHDRGVLVNRVDKVSEVIIPSVIHRGSITIAISTAAASPALSKYLREMLEEIITPEFEDMARLQEEMRKVLKKEVAEQNERRKILWEILRDDEVWKALRDSYEKAYTLSLSHIYKTNN
jgi:precorrin-2 dehydrogenase/sirohydrochlorin ferrochelatase